MRLKRLEISGFKTFRDKVVFEFSPGVSGVIGPNGCGKSNVIDALRWVMGEQRVKAIRGKKMDDVIFNGSESAPPVGMAEVTMTLLNDGQPFPGAYGDCNEVMVGRRLFREGDSEYYINKVSCRLLDVKEFFMDTGVGTRTYSLVEQNSVSNLVEAKPEERRQFIEEAAGIAKYKSRKDAALRKMEATKQNMVRLHDIMKEVKTQLNAVSRQAKRAEQYKNLKQEIREAELSLAASSYADLKERIAGLEKQRDALQRREGEIAAELKAREAALEELKLLLLEEGEMVSRSREELYNLKNAVNMKEQGIEFSRKRIADLSLKRQRDLQEMKERERKLSESIEEISALKEAGAVTEREIRDLQERVVTHQQQLEVLRRADRKLYEEIEEKKVAYIDVAAEKAKLKNMETNILKVVEDMKRRQDRHLKEMEEYNRRDETLQQTLEELIWGLQKDEEKRDACTERHGELTQELSEAKLRLKDLEASRAVLKEESGRKAARLTSLQEFQEQYTWCSEGTKSIMTAWKNGGLGGLSGDVFLGLVADHIDVPREYETAVEAVLGERLQYVVVRSQEDGARAIDYLKQSAQGRGTFVPLEVRNHVRDLPLADHLRDSTVSLFDKVGVHEDFREIVAYLLGDVLLTPNLRAGLSLWRQNGFRGTFVTPEGDIINPQGVMTGGATNKAERSLLANKREIAELQEELSRISRKLSEAEARKAEWEQMVPQLEEELQLTKSEMHRLEIQINSQRKDVERFEDERKRIGQRRGILEFDNETMIAEQKESLEKMAFIKEEKALQEERERVINEEIDSLKEKNGLLKQDLEGWEKKCTAAKVHLATCEEKRESDRKALFRLETTREALQRELKEKRAEEEHSVAQEEELAESMKEEQDKLTALYERYRVLEGTLAEKITLEGEKEALLKSREKEQKEVKQNLDQAAKEAAELEISLREKAYQLEGLRKNITEKHYVDLEELYGQYSALPEEDLQNSALKLEKARATVENFGEVNLLAINEYEELRERHDFLTAQDTDIRTSLESLQQTIERINRISRTRFAETFAAVNASFQDMFARIFPGGKGQLCLTDEGDMLETGVEIDIQIPGKRTRNISLLSGGEKSLAAIALIFAILQYRPTPFLVLDEVDAALDDANIALFNKLIKDISQKSQIVMVTHNKRTMEVAENLYGITMQNQGISTLVSVNLN